MSVTHQQYKRDVISKFFQPPPLNGDECYFRPHHLEPIRGAFQPTPLNRDECYLVRRIADVGIVVFQPTPLNRDECYTLPDRETYDQVILSTNSAEQR